ncbi:ATPase [Cronobacter phage vB_CsaP_009]|uniref:Putative ATPase n=1 Tax=Cronobacter phage vB_CsaP_009 TaxID=2699738 RepID=A0A679FF76_9CAUD|nr:ATPase [Cronobacter phage vB_CsaP_009]BBU72675.1 putative ATPase [Cronobacter phage vB_CsaP_009]
MLQEKDGIVSRASNADKRFEVLEGGHYTYSPATMTTPPYFKKVSEPSVPSKIYGDPSAKVMDVMKTIHDRSPQNNTGVLAVGEKGSGKTMMLNILNNELASKMGFPVIHFDAPYDAATITSMIELAGRPLVFFIDEFEKKYQHKDQQNDLLTIMDGGINTGNVFLLSANVKSVSEYMIDRPNRIHYTFKYDHLGWDIIQDYLNDKLDDKTKAEYFKIMSENSNMNFDILQNLTAEVNRFPDRPFVDSVKMMGLSIRLDSVEKKYKMTELTLGGINVKGYDREYNLIPHVVSKGKQQIYIAFDNEALLKIAKQNHPEFFELKDGEESYKVYSDIENHLDDIPCVRNNGMDYRRYKDYEGNEKEHFSLSFHVGSDDPAFVSVKKDTIEVHLELFGQPLYARLDQAKEIDLIDVIFS